MGENRDFLLHTTFGTEKLVRCGYLAVKKKFEDMFTWFDTIHERDGHQTDRRTDRRTPRDGIGRTCSLARHSVSLQYRLLTGCTMLRGRRFPLRSCPKLVFRYV